MCKNVDFLYVARKFTYYLRLRSLIDEILIRGVAKPAPVTVAKLCMLTSPPYLLTSHTKHMYTYNIKILCFRVCKAVVIILHI
jgi:hypothetical protein